MSPLRKSRPWLAVMMLLSLAAILYTRLIPFGFAWDGRIPFERLTLAPLTLRDVPLNVLLFVPFGFGMAGGLGAGRRKVVIAAVMLSAALEAVQLFMPLRAPSLADVAANGVGALLGYGLYRAWAMGVGRALHRYATRRNLLLGLGAYTLLAALLTSYLYRSVRLSNWDASFPLVVGNEAVGRRQWSGDMAFLTMDVRCDGAPTAGAAYDFAGEAPFEDVGQGTNAPPLVRRDGPTTGSSTAQGGDGVTVGPGEWLATTGPLGDFSAAARRCSYFSIETAVATADPAQRGPARIVSISADAERRNVTLGQERDALIIRLRTPAGGENGQKPELLVPGVFADERLRRITVSYDMPMLRATVDGDEYALSLAPGAAFFPGFASENRWPVIMYGDPHRYDWAYWGIVIGLAALIFGGLALSKRVASTRPDVERTEPHGNQSV